jgi:hypothetical protein
MIALLLLPHSIYLHDDIMAFAHGRYIYENIITFYLTVFIFVMAPYTFAQITYTYDLIEIFHNSNLSDGTLHLPHCSYIYYDKGIFDFQ